MRNFCRAGVGEAGNFGDDVIKTRKEEECLMLNCSYADSTGDGRVSAHMQIFRGVVPKRFYELVTLY